MVEDVGPVAAGPSTGQPSDHTGNGNPVPAAGGSGNRGGRNRGRGRRRGGPKSLKDDGGSAIKEIAPVGQNSGSNDSSNTNTNTNTNSQLQKSKPQKNNTGGDNSSSKDNDAAGSKESDVKLPPQNENEKSGRRSRSDRRRRGRGGKAGVTVGVASRMAISTDDSIKTEAIEDESTAGNIDQSNQKVRIKAGRTRRQNETRGLSKGRDIMDKNTDSALGELARGLRTALNKEEHECHICTEHVRWKQGIWSCETCYAVYHLKCIRQWAKSSRPTQNVGGPSVFQGSSNVATEIASAIGGVGNNSGTGKQVTVNWRCPNCNAGQSRHPTRYRCFCGKTTDPQHSFYLDAHSCGETCARKLLHRRTVIAGSEDDSNDATNRVHTDGGGALVPCGHICVHQCHAGPCPPCQSTITVPCHCGVTSTQQKCSHISIASCGATCRRPMPCGIHRCERICHPGECAPSCGIVQEQECFCGQHSRRLECGEDNFVYGQLSEDGLFPDIPSLVESQWSCGNRCNRKYDCEKHQCRRECHRGACGVCPRAPSQVTRCPCGKTCLPDEIQRTACTDAIPSCGKPCGKELDCGHGCQALCHDPETDGPCPPCQAYIRAQCRCGRTMVEGVCAEVCMTTASGPQAAATSPDAEQQRDSSGTTVRAGGGATDTGTQDNFEEFIAAITLPAWYPEGNAPFSAKVELRRQPKCQKPCGDLLDCGRHRCNLRCCPGNGAFASTGGGRKKHTSQSGLSRTLQAKRAFSTALHDCQRPCGKMLRCGQHACEKRCHKGPCPPCLHAIWNDLTCACGAQRLEPPQPCGTKPPVCDQPCPRAQPCGHLATHTCHPDGPCAPCHARVTRRCAGGHVLRKNVPCHIAEAGVSCGAKCKKFLPCGRHVCKRLCHAGDCLTDDRRELYPGGILPDERCCGQTCGAPRDLCEHSCHQPCHAQLPCPLLPCQEKIKAHCGCGRRNAQVRCLKGGDISVLQDALQALDPGEWESGTVVHNSDAAAEAGDAEGGIAAKAEGAKAANGEDKILSHTSSNVSALRNSNVYTLWPPQLRCDLACEKLRRDRDMAEALRIDGDGSGAGGHRAGQLQHVPKYPDELLRAVHDRGPQSDFILDVEQTLNRFVTDRGRPPLMDLPVMSRLKRDLVHQLAEVYRLESESIDPEPRRSVRVWRTPECAIPSMVLSQAARDLRLFRSLQEEQEVRELRESMASATIAADQPASLFEAIAADGAQRASSGDGTAHEAADEWFESGTRAAASQYTTTMTDANGEEWHRVPRKSGAFGSNAAEGVDGSQSSELKERTIWDALEAADEEGNSNEEGNSSEDGSGGDQQQQQQQQDAQEQSAGVDD
eukprot:Clim_evm18s220 gene=Clim_evmTU18s220